MALDVDNKNPWNVLMQLAGKINGTDNVSHDDLQKLLKEADENGDGIIELQEFKDAFLTSEEYKKLEDEYLEAFESIAKLDGEEESISTEDIEDAIAEYDKLDTEETAPEAPQNVGGGGSSGGGGGGSQTTGADKKEAVGDLTSKELPELKSERSDVLSDITALRTEKGEAVTKVDAEVDTAQEGYNDATKALADIVKEKVKAEKTTNEYADEVIVFEDQKNALQSDITEQEGVISEATNLVSTISGQLSSLTAPPQTISYKDEKTGETVTKENPAYADYLAQKAALEEELAAAEADLAAQEEALVSLESDLSDAEALLENAIVAYAQAEQAEGKLTEEEVKAIEDISKQSEVYNAAKVAKAEVSADYDKQMDTLQANLVAYNDAITEKELELPEGYGVEDSKITNGENNLEQIAKDELPEGYTVDGSSIKDAEGNVVGMVTGTEEAPQLYLIEKIEPESMGAGMCYYNARMLFEEAIANGVDPAESTWASCDFTTVNSEDVKKMEEYYNELVSEYNANLEDGQTAVKTFTEEAKSRYAESEDKKANYEAIVDSIEKANSKEKVRPDSFEAYLNKNNVDIKNATEAQMSEYLDKFMEEKYGELYKEDYYPPVTEEQLNEYIGEGGLEALKEADEADVTSKINKILTDEKLTPYEQMQLLETIKSYSEDTKSYVDNYFKNDDTYFATQLEKMMSAENEDGTSKYSPDDLLEFVKQYKCLDNTSSVLGSDDNVGDKSKYQNMILELYERMETTEQVSELEGYLSSDSVLELSDTNSKETTSRLFNVFIKDSLQEDGKLSLEAEKYGISKEDADEAKSKYLDGNSNDKESIKSVLNAVSSGEISSDMAKYLLANISNGDASSLMSQIQNMTNEEQEAYIDTMFSVISGDKTSSDTTENDASNDASKEARANKPAETLEEFLASIDDPQAKKWYSQMFNELGYDYDTFWTQSNIPRDFQSVYTDAFASGTIRSAGCGITSLSMLSEYLTGEYKAPDELTQGYIGDNPASALYKGLDQMGVDYKLNWGEDAFAALDSYLDAGKPVIVNVRETSIFTNGGHYMVIAGKTDDGKYIVNDPNIENYLNPNMVDGFTNGFTREQIIQGLSYVITLD